MRSTGQEQRENETKLHTSPLVLFFRNFVLYRRVAVVKVLLSSFALMLLVSRRHQVLSFSLALVDFISYLANVLAPSQQGRCEIKNYPMITLAEEESIVVRWQTNCAFPNSKAFLSDCTPGIESSEEKLKQWGDLKPIERPSNKFYYILTIPKSDYGHRQIQNVSQLSCNTFRRLCFKLHLESSAFRVPVDPAMTCSMEIPCSQFATKQVVQPTSGRIVLLSDAQSQRLKFSELLYQSKWALSPQLLLLLGDAIQGSGDVLGLGLHIDPLTNTRDYSREWRYSFHHPFHQAGLRQDTPVLFAHGNHDMDSTWEFRNPGSPDKFFFATNWGEAGDRPLVRFIVLDTKYLPSQRRHDPWLKEAQARWLQEELVSHDFQRAVFRVVVSHVPPFVEYWNKEAWLKKGEKNWANLMLQFVELFQQAGVDLVLSGHQHRYQRGVNNGVQYLISGGGGAELDYERVETYGFYSVDTARYHYCSIEVSAEKMIVKAIAESQQVFDEFVIYSKV